MWSPVRKKRWVSSLMESTNFTEYYSNLLSQTENIFHLFRPGLIMPVPGGKFDRLLAPEKRRVNIPSYLSVYYLTYDIFCHYRLKWKKTVRVEILWRTVSLLPALSKTMLMALVIILVFAKKLRICLPDSPDTSGRKPYQERKRCGLKNIRIRVDGALYASKNIRY